MADPSSFSLPQWTGPAPSPGALAAPLISPLPVLIFDVHFACNQTCSYCVSGSSPQNEFGAFGNPEKIAQIYRFFETHGPFTVVFTGGEPLITPGISELFTRLQALGHRIALQSNLKSHVERFTQAVSPEDCAWLLTTFHSVELNRWARYRDTVVGLKRAGYPLVVKIVLDEPMLPVFASLYDDLVSEGVGVMLSPLIHFPAGGESTPHAYSVEDWSHIAPRISLRSTWLYFAGGFRSKGCSCDAGRSLFYAHTARHGEVAGCGHSFPRKLGSLYDNKFAPLDQAVPCGLQRCICDFHYYTGVVRGLDDSAGFAALTQGPRPAVPFTQYAAWLAAAGLEPAVDLRPVIEAIGSAAAAA